MAAVGEIGEDGDEVAGGGAVVVEFDFVDGIALGEPECAAVGPAPPVEAEAVDGFLPVTSLPAGR